MLFIGSDVDVRSGFVNTLRNSGIVVSQLSGKGSDDLKNPFNDPSFLENSKLFTESQKAKMKELKNKKSNENFSSDNKVPELRLTSYLRNINGDKKILSGSFADFKQAVEKITKWREDKNKEKVAAKMQSESSSGEDLVEEEEPVEVQHIWYLLDDDFDGLGTNYGSFTFTNKSSIGDNGDYSINVNGVSRPYPYTNLFEHKVVADPADFYTITKAEMRTYASDWSYESKYKYRLEEYHPLNSSNGPLSGASGSTTYGFSSGVGLSQSPDASLGFDWSSTTDWSRPACEISTSHNTGPWPVFAATYDIDRTGTWAGDTVTAEGSSAFLTKDKETRNNYVNYYYVQLYAKGGLVLYDYHPKDLVVFMIGGASYVGEYRRGFDYPELIEGYGPYYW